LEGCQLLIKREEAQPIHRPERSPDHGRSKAMINDRIIEIKSTIFINPLLAGIRLMRFI
jgi:hypothetical protein